MSTLNETRVHTARTDFSQIKRPVPVKLRPAMSIYDLQLPQTDIPQGPPAMARFHVQTSYILFH